MTLVNTLATRIILHHTLIEYLLNNLNVQNDRRLNVFIFVTEIQHAENLGPKVTLDFTYRYMVQTYVIPCSVTLVYL